jgi:putative ABC transport system substrate-binding protein
VADPVGAGFVASLAQPGRNVTGFSLFEYGLSGKWLELLREMVPGVKRVAVLRDSNNSSGIGQFAAIQAVAPALGIELRPVDAQDASEIEQALATFARSKGALIVTSGTQTLVHRNLIVALAARHRLPAVYGSVQFARSGGLLCYGPDVLDDFRRAAGYVDRILKGERAADLPVQAPTKYQIAINLKTARELGLDIPPTLLARADEVIE